LDESLVSVATWCNQDLFFLADALRRGMSFAQVAGFLGKDVSEVRDKAKQLSVKVAADDARAHGTALKEGARRARHRAAEQ
jgi:hypothetical protein